MRHEQDSENSEEWKHFIETTILSPEEKEEEEKEEKLEIEIVENKFKKLTEVVSSNSVYWQTHAVHNTSVLISETQRIGKMVLWDVGCGKITRHVDDQTPIWYADFCDVTKHCLVATDDSKNKQTAIVKYYDSNEIKQRPKCCKMEHLLGLNLVHQRPMVVQSTGCTMNLFSRSKAEIKFSSPIDCFDYDGKQTLWGLKSIDNDNSTQLIVTSLEAAKSHDFIVNDAFTNVVLSKTSPSIVLYNEKDRTMVRHDSREKLEKSVSDIFSFLVPDDDRHPDRDNYRHEISHVEIDPDDMKIWYSFCGRIHCLDTRNNKSQLMVQDQFGWLSQFKIDHSNRRMLIDNGASFCGDETYSLDVYSI
jgi:hypothetical protein